VEELIRLAAPLTAEENESLPLESATSPDAHFGDALCQICAMVHFHIAVNEGLKRIEPKRLEYLRSDGRRKCQRLAKCDQIELVLFAPGGEDAKSGRFNPIFRHYFARINSAFGSPLRGFPSRAILNGVHLAGAVLSHADLSDVRLDSANLAGARLSLADLAGANLSRANLDCADLAGANLSEAILDSANLPRASLSYALLTGADLSQANLDGANLAGASFYYARLDGASLSGASLGDSNLEMAIGLTREQVESAWIDERTRLTEELEKIKPEILKQQRLREEELIREAPAPEFWGRE